MSTLHSTTQANQEVSGGNQITVKTEELYTRTEDLLFGSSAIKLDETHVSEFVGLPNIFSHEKCNSCDGIAEQRKNLEVTAQTQMYHLSVAQATNKLLKNKLQELEGRLQDGGSALVTLQEEVNAAAKEKQILEEKLKMKLASGNMQTESISSTAPMVTEKVESHGVDTFRTALQPVGYFCLCGEQFPTEMGLYQHFKLKFSASTKEVRVNIMCSICKQKLYTWDGLIAHTLRKHQRRLEDVLCMRQFN